jgi:hypothetical protein
MNTDNGAETRKTDVAVHMNRLRREAAERYALADKSDPFCRTRIATHMRTGVCRFTLTGEDAFYSADATTEECVTADGKPYLAMVYRNMVRP